jgi:hypothetical protein
MDFAILVPPALRFDLINGSSYRCGLEQLILRGRGSRMSTGSVVRWWNEPRIEWRIHITATPLPQPYGSSA